MSRYSFMLVVISFLTLNIGFEALMASDLKSPPPSESCPITDEAVFSSTVYVHPSWGNYGLERARYQAKDDVRFQCLICDYDCQAPQCDPASWGSIFVTCRAWGKKI